MRQQAERWGSELLTEDVEHVDLSSRPFTIRSSDTEVCTPGPLFFLAGMPLRVVPHEACRRAASGAVHISRGGTKARCALQAAGQGGVGSAPNGRLQCSPFPLKLQRVSVHAASPEEWQLPTWGGGGARSGEGAQHHHCDRRGPRRSWASQARTSSGTRASAPARSATAPPPATGGRELAVVGGGDTAAEEALYLTKYGTKVGAARLVSGF